MKLEYQKEAYAEIIKDIYKEHDVFIVVGGGNFWRGRTSETIDRTKADQIGMLATVMNCIYVSEIFRSVGMETEIYTPFQCASFTELFSKDKAVNALENGKVVFFAGGTGHPYFSTDFCHTLLHRGLSHPFRIPVRLPVPKKVMLHLLQ